MTWILMFECFIIMTMKIIFTLILRKKRNNFSKFFHSFSLIFYLSIDTVNYNKIMEFCNEQRLTKSCNSDSFSTWLFYKYLWAIKKLCNLCTSELGHCWPKLEDWIPQHRALYSTAEMTCNNFHFLRVMPLL